MHKMVVGGTDKHFDPTVDNFFQNRGHLGGTPHINALHEIAGQHYSPEELEGIRQTVEHHFSRAATVIQTPEEVAHTVLTMHRYGDENRFENQHSTGESQGLYDPETRLTLEYAHHGYDPDPDSYAHEAHHRPIYGHLHDNPLLMNLGDVSSSYGGVGFVLRPALDRRTTAMFGNSLDHAELAYPSPKTSPHMHSILAHPQLLGHLHDVAQGRAMFSGALVGTDRYSVAGRHKSEIDPDHVNRVQMHAAGLRANGYDTDTWSSSGHSLTPHSYIEAQVHGGVHLGDVAFVNLYSSQGHIAYPGAHIKRDNQHYENYDIHPAHEVWAQHGIPVLLQNEMHVNSEKDIKGLQAMFPHHNFGRYGVKVR